MFQPPRGARAAHRARPPLIATWRVLAALALALATPPSGWRGDAVSADDPIILSRPDAGAVVAAGAPIRFSWEPMARADAYRVVFDDGNRTGPWVATTTWESGSLPSGRHRWRVTARTPVGLVASGERAFQVDAGEAGGAVSVAQPAAPTTPARLDLAAGSAVVGARLSVTGTGFAPGETVAFAWERSGEDTPERAIAGDDGDWTTSVLAPEAPGGVETLAARGETSGALARATLTIVPSLERTPPGGPPGAQIEVNLRGFAPNEQVELRWENDGRPLATALTHEDGAARIRFAIPDAAAGIGSLVAIGQTSGGRAPATLRVYPASASEPDATPAAPERPTVGTDQTIGPGSFAVQAAPTGTDGGATTSGHNITADDRFADLPICVTTSCPWLDPGVNHPLWGVRIECGAACFVRVANPASGRCVVAPVLDVGPWFTGDDWWDAAPHRRINRLDGGVYTLATGYAAAAAARDGYDVGFGLSPNGVGISDRGYEVGDGAALGLAAGSWADLGFAPDQGAASVEASLLWLTGDDPDAAAAACEAANAATPAMIPADSASASIATPEPATLDPATEAAPAASAPAVPPVPSATAKVAGSSSAAPNALPASPPTIAPTGTPANSPPPNDDQSGNRRDSPKANAPGGDSPRADDRPSPSDDEPGKPGDRDHANRNSRDHNHDAERETPASS